VKTHLLERAGKLHLGCVDRYQALKHLVLGEGLLVWSGGAAVLERAVAATVALYAVGAVETAIGAIVVTAWAAVITVIGRAAAAVITIEAWTSTAVFAWSPVTTVATVAAVIAGRTVVTVVGRAAAAVITVETWAATTVITVETWASTAVLARSPIATAVLASIRVTVAGWAVVAIVGWTATAVIAGRTVVTVEAWAATAVITVETWASATVIAGRTVIAVEASLAGRLEAAIARWTVLVATLLAWGILLRFEESLALVGTAAATIFAWLELWLGCAGRLAVARFARGRARGIVAKFRHFCVSS